MKSPLKAKPLKNPGESLDIELKDLLFADVLSYFISKSALQINAEDVTLCAYHSGRYIRTVE